MTSRLVNKQAINARTPTFHARALIEKDNARLHFLLVTPSNPAIVDTLLCLTTDFLIFSYL